MSQETILIIDDNKDLAQDLVELLEGRELRARAEFTAAAGLAAARASTFHVALVDMKLPDAIGVELLGALKETSPFIEVIFMTAFASIDTAIRAVSGHAYAYVQKPFEVRALLDLVARAHRQASLATENQRLRMLAEAILRSSVGLAWVVSQDTGLEASFGGGDILPETPSLGTKPSELSDPLLRELLSSSGVLERHGVRYPKASLDVWAGPLTPDDTKRRLLVFRDASSRVEIEQRVKLAQQLASLGEMAKTLAHEISNPLAAIQLQLDLVESVLEGAPEAHRAAHSSMSMIHQEVERLSQLLRDFLDFARPDALQREITDLESLCRGVISMWEPRFNAKEITLSMEVASPLPLIKVDPGKLRQVLLNLLKNSLEALPVGGQCHLSLSSEQRCLTLRIQDDGPGIPSAVLATPGMTTKPHGSGLGLPIIRRIIENHGGFVQIETSPRGTCIRIELPLQ